MLTWTSTTGNVRIRPWTTGHQVRCLKKDNQEGIYPNHRRAYQQAWLYNIQRETLLI